MRRVEGPERLEPGPGRFVLATIAVVGVALLALVLLGVWPREPSPDPSRAVRRAAVREALATAPLVRVADLVHRYRATPAEARVLHDQKPVAASGIVTAVESYQGALSGTTVLVRLGDEGGAQATCLFDDEDRAETDRLTTGRMAVVVGISTGLSSDGASAYLEHCLVR